MPNFTDVWNKSGMILGAFSPEEGRVLYEKAMFCGVNALYVEIGSYLGRSSSILGQVANFNSSELICIDPFIDGCGQLNLLPEQMRGIFEANMKKVGVKYKLYPMKSEEAEKQLQEIKIDLLFIDGDHRYEGVKTDCRLWFPKVKVGGYALFHDYQGEGWPGVKKAVDEAIKSKQFTSEGIMQSLLVLRRING